MRYRHRIWLLCLAVATVVGLCYAAQAAPAEKPNIIFIMVDDLGYGDLGCYGQKQIKTPNLDRMAVEGMRFTQFYAGSTVCAPSRCVLMTGTHTGRAQVRGNRETRPMGQHPLPPDTLTVAKLLKQAGYATALVGKWGLGGPDTTGEPNRQGFDYFYGYLCQRHAHNYYPEFLFRNRDRVVLEGNRIAKPRPDGAGFAVQRAQYSHDLIADEALSFVDRYKDGPFFLYLAMTIPHANNEAGNKGMEVPDLGEYADKDWPAPQKGTAAMITRMDRDIGRLFDRLRQHDIDDRTLVMFTSDNGPHAEGGNNPHFFDSNGPLRGIKRDLYDGGIRVPMIARWPGLIEAGATSDHIGYFGDLMATAAELVGAKARAGLNSVSFVPTLLGDDDRQQDHPYLYWEFYRGRSGMKQAVRMGPWKGIRNAADAPMELYDMTKDIGETENVATEHAEVVKKIETAMQEAHVPSEIWTTK